MDLIFWIALELTRLASRPVIAEIDGRPTRIELVRPDDRPMRLGRPQR
jgi:hypothetical protein